MEAATHPTKHSHEEFIHAIRDIVVKYQSDAAIRERLLGVKLVYGIGAGHYRGICYYGAWQNGHTTDFLEIAATGEESPTQLAGTTIHELGHVIAGNGAGHGAQWKAACLSLGLTATQAGGQHYEPEHFAPHIWADVEKLAPSDGTPIFGKAGAGFIGLRPAILKPCPLGIGTRGGKSRGPGSGSRMRKFVCGCVNAKTGLPIPVRRASDVFNATCHDCGKDFTRDDGEPAARVNAQPVPVEPAQVAADSIVTRSAIVTRSDGTRVRTHAAVCDDGTVYAWDSPIESTGFCNSCGKSQTLITDPELGESVCKVCRSYDVTKGGNNHAS